MDLSMSCNDEPGRKCSRLDKIPPIDIEFQNLSYTVGSKLILKSVNGKFCSGKLIGILGPSGAGKSTLLNVLAGHVGRGVSGNIKISNKPRDMKIFRKLSTYIMQDDLLQPLLTVNEAMTVAAKLKLGNEISLIEKEAIITEVLSTLGLDKCRETRMERLSGGQRKRLAVALELVNNPPVIFLDEPTSGLDNVATKQCMEVLRTLADQRRTVICTIHQPPRTILEKFDQLYFISNGMCFYNGSPSSIISHLSSAEFSCPITYDPAEYMMEIVQSNEEYLNALVNSIQNGKLYRRNSEPTVPYSSDIYQEIQSLKIYETNLNFPTSFLTQFMVLFSRMMLQQRRNLLVIWIQLFNHVISGGLIGVVFYGIGNDANMAFANFKLCVCVMHFFVYTYVMTPVLLFPFEVRLLKREYFNRWYSLKAYYLALTLRSLPLLVTMGLSFLMLTYVLSSQPFEIYRIILYCCAGVMVAMASEALGVAIGSVFNIKNGSLLAAAIDSAVLILSIYGMGYGTLIDPFMKTLMGISYLRYAVVLFCLALYDQRSAFECSEVYCHYSNPKMLLKDLGMTNTTYTMQMIGLIVFLILFRLIAFIALRYRLKSDKSFTIVNYVTKVFRRK